MKLKVGEKGFTLIELLVTISIAAFVVGAASMTIITMMRLSPQSNNWAIALRQVQNTGYWISRDVLSSQGEIEDNPTPPEFLRLTLPQAPPALAKTIVYQFEDMSGGLKRLMRTDQGVGQIMIAEYISLPDTTANYNSDNCTLTFTITAIIAATSDNTTVTRQYKATQRVPPP